MLKSGELGTKVNCESVFSVTPLVTENELPVVMIVVWVFTLLDDVIDPLPSVDPMIDSVAVEIVVLSSLKDVGNSL